MTSIVYEIVEHNGGFAYKVGDVYSETFGTHKAAHAAAEDAAARQGLAGAPEDILYQDEKGQWHKERAAADDHPDASVEDPLPEEIEARDANGRAFTEAELPNPDLAPLPDLHKRG
ncbi:MAG: DUF2188 domain-containing protein [Devosia sp.]